MRSVFAVLTLTMVGCSSHTSEMRGDWCGTDRAQIRYAGELLEKCDGGDFLACERADAECNRGNKFFCPNAPPRMVATPLQLRARVTTGCDAGKSEDCMELAQLLERAGEDAEPVYQRECDRGHNDACARVGDRISARAVQAENAGDWTEAARLHRVGCFKDNVGSECTALEAFRKRAKLEADGCEAGQTDVCQRAAGMLRAASQGPSDEARADALERRFSR